MDGKRVNYFVVGSFVLLMLVALLLTLVKLSGWAADRSSFFTVFSRVAGLQDGTKVLYQGFPIGRVTGIQRLTERDIADIGDGAARNRLREALKDGATRFRVNFEVEKGWRIPSNAEAEVIASGLLAAVSVNIVERPVEPGEAVSDVAPGATAFVPGVDPQDIFARAARLADSIQSLVEAAEQTLKSKVDPTMDDVQVLVRTVSNEVPPLIRRAQDFVETINGAANDVRLLVGDKNRAQVDAVLTKLNGAAGDLNTLMSKLNRLATSANELVDANRRGIDQSVESLRYTLSTIARDIDTISRNVEATTRNLQEFSRQVRENPGVLIGGTSPRDTGGRRQ